jgi:hypothetical protein
VKRAGLFLRRAAVVLAGLTLLVWLGGGAHRGWTQTSVPVEKTDEVTGLTYREYQPRFRPGVDFLGAGLLAAAGLAGVGWTLDRRPGLR